MKIRLQADADFNMEIVAGVLRRELGLHLVQQGPYIGIGHPVQLQIPSLVLPELGGNRRMFQQC